MVVRNGQLVADCVGRLGWPSSRDPRVNQLQSFPEFLQSRAGRTQLARWAGTSAVVFSVGFGLLAWYAEAEVPLFFWPFIAGGGALLGLHFCYLRWQAVAGRGRVRR